MLPLYEGKMGHQYDYRSATFTGTGDTDIKANEDHSALSVVLPRYWVREGLVVERLDRREWGSQAGLLGFRRVARNTDERTCIATVIPWGAASYGWIISAGPSADELAILCAQYNSFLFDYLIRQFLSQPSIPQGTFEQLPALPRVSFSGACAYVEEPWVWLGQRVGHLVSTGTELAEYGVELNLPSSPASWNERVRETFAAEIDALMFHLYGIERDDVDYIMETFPIVKRKDIAAHGEFRTKRMILEIYDAMRVAIDTGIPYRSEFDEELTHG